MRRRPKPRRRPPVIAKQVGLVRYRAEDWNRWLEIADDRDKWERTFAEWQRHAEGVARRLARAGLQIVWVELEPDSFAEWCRTRGYPIDGEARSRFAAERIGNIPPPEPPA